MPNPQLKLSQIQTQEQEMSTEAEDIDMSLDQEVLLVKFINELRLLQ